MNRFFNWLAAPDSPPTPSAHTPNAMQTERKSGHALVAFHTGGVAAWSAFESSGVEEGFCRNPIVYRCVRMISEAAGSLAVRACEKRVDCDEHPVLDLLARPNEKQSRNRFLETLYGHLLISGNAHVVRIMADTGVRELHILDPRKVTPVLDEAGWPVAYDHQSGALKTRYNSEVGGDILHLALFNPASGVNGLPPLAAAHMALEIHNAASNWNKALLDNSARPSGALVYAAGGNENLSEDQFERLKRELEEGYTGASQAGRPMVLEGGLDWKAMGYSPRDMDFLEAKNGAAREIALAFGVPPMLLGIPGDNTYSNYQEANRAFWTQTVLPLAHKTTADLGHWLAETGDRGITLRIDTETVPALAQDREAYWNRIGNASFLTDNEKREALGFAPMEGGQNDG
ncbi:MAG: phage portal protein [Pseudomonadota bacterium]